MADKSNQGKSFQLSKLARIRWNVLDLIGIVGANSIPTYLFLEIDMTWSEELRAQLTKYGAKTTITAFLLKAIAIAQHAHPDSRSVLLPFGRVATLNDVVAGFTVERFINSQPTIFFGAIHSPDTKSIAQISQELREHAEADFDQVDQLDLQYRFTWMPWFLRRIVLWFGLRDAKLRLNCMGATFGLSSLGKFGLSAMIPPCVTTSTFGIGTVEPRAVVRDGEIQIRKMMTLTLNFDHRLIDGAPAARFLNDIRALMEGGLEKYLQEELRELRLAASNMADLTTTVSPSFAPAEVN